ncbi:MAG: hypothetical protein Salg2KO_12870 [Salibacteraceae bacterium]
MSDIYEYSDEELQELGKIIVWTTVYAAVHNDGVINASERAEAIKQTHIRTFSSEEYLQPIYKHLDSHFEADFDAAVASLSGSQEEKEAVIQERIADATHILSSIGPLFTDRFTKELTNLYNRVFIADSSIFQIFMLPILTSQLNKHNKK